MIILPKGAVIVKQRVQKYESTSSLIMDDVEGLDKIYNDGEIRFTAPELVHLQFAKIVFRPNFAEAINIKGEDFLYFRDLESSMYYILQDD